MRRLRVVISGLLLFNALVLSAAVLVVRQHRHHPPALSPLAESSSQSLPLPHFALQDCHGQPVSDRTYRGKVLLVYFGYSFCPDVCPTELGYQARLLQALRGDASEVVPLFITIDPGRDTPEHLARYVALFDRRICGLTGSEAQIRQAAQAFGAWYQRATPTTMGGAAASSSSSSSSTVPGAEHQDPELYLMDHSSSTYLIDRSGHLQGTLDPGARLDDAVAAVRSCL